MPTYARRDGCGASSGRRPCGGRDQHRRRRLFSFPRLDRDASEVPPRANTHVGDRRSRRSHIRLRRGVRGRRCDRSALARLGGALVPGARRGDGADRVARGLHGVRPLRERHPADLGVQLRRGARPLPRDARRLARLSDPLPGSRLLLRLVGVHGGRVLPLHGSCARPGSSPAWIDPELGLPARDDSSPDADRGQRRRCAARLPEDRRAPRVRSRGRRLPRRRLAGSAAGADAGLADGRGAGRRRVRHRPRRARLVGG